MLENKMSLTKKAKEEAPSQDWIKKAKEVIQEIAISDRQKRSQQRFEKLPRLDLRELDGSEEEPATLLIKALSDRREVKTERMTRPMFVFDAEVLVSTSEKAKAGKYSIWENTTVLHREINDYAQKYGEKGSIEGKTFIIAYYGQVKSKMGKMVYIFRCIPYENAA